MLLVSVGIILLAACRESTAPANPSDAEFAIISTKNSYIPGESVSVQFFNRSDKPVGYGPCPLGLERQAGNQWIKLGSIEHCLTAILLVLEPNGTRTLQTKLDSTLQSGTYRFYVQVFPNTNLPTRFVYSPKFRVENGA